MNEISIVAAVAINSEGRLLLVRKRGTTAFMQPGGKLEPKESHTAALCRELAEELQWNVDNEQLERMGEFSCSHRPSHNLMSYFNSYSSWMTIQHSAEFPK